MDLDALRHSASHVILLRSKLFSFELRRNIEEE